MRKIFFFIPVFLFLLLAIGLSSALQHGKPAPSSPLLHKPFPLFTLQSIFPHDAALDSGEFKGNMVLINVFASWCMACRIEHPLLLELAKKKHLLIYGLNWKDNDDVARTWLEEHGNPYTKIGADRDGRIAIELGITGAPETYLVDKKGVIIYHLAGALTEKIIQEELYPLIEEQVQ